MWRTPRRIDEAVERRCCRRASMAATRLRDRGLAVAVALAQRRQRRLVAGQAEDVGRLADQALVEEGLQLLDRPAPRCRRRGARRSGSGARCAGTGRRTRRCSGGPRRGSACPRRPRPGRRGPAACAAGTGSGSGTRTARRPSAAPPAPTPTICGITSPARWMITVSPTRTSLRAISSALCKVAFSTTTPPTVTGVSRATGVTAPVRPTWMSMAFRMVRACCGRELAGDRPARRAGDEAQALLPVQPVDLVDHAVDVEAEVRARRSISA